MMVLLIIYDFGDTSGGGDGDSGYGGGSGTVS